MTTILTVTTTPQTFASGLFPLATLNGGPAWRTTVTPKLASTDPVYSAFEALAATNDQGGLWTENRKIELYEATTGALVVGSGALTWSANQPITIEVHLAVGTNASSLVISGATTGNGTFTFTLGSQTFFTATTLGTGVYSLNGTFLFDGDVGSFDDMAATVFSPAWAPVVPTTSLRRIASAALMMSVLTAPIAPPTTPALSWSPRMPEAPLVRARSSVNTGGTFAPVMAIAAPTAPALSWAVELPDGQLRLARQVVNTGGHFAPTLTIPTPPSPPLAWAAELPDGSLRRARSSVNVGGAVGPVLVIPNTDPGWTAWAPTYPDFARAARRGQGPSLHAPPFAGGQRLTVGAAAIRQSILSQLPFSTPLTTFATDLTFTASGDTLTTGTHAMVVCAGPFQLRTTGTLPAGSDSTTLYYMICPSSTTVKLALTAALAKAGTAVTLSDAGTGTHTLVRAVNTAPLYSTLLAFFMRGTQSTSPNQATDSAGNTYSYVSPYPRIYDNFTISALSISTAFRARGGNAHTWSASIGNVGGQQDEVTIGGLELFDAQILQSSSVVERVNGGAATITSGTVTTTAKALLVAVVAGNGNVNQAHVFTVLDGYTKVARVCADGDVDPAGYIQIEVWTRLVDIAGTYSFRAQGTVSADGPEGAILSLLAFQAVTSDLQPFDWLMPQAEMPHVPRRGQTAGETRVDVVAATVPPLTWAPVMPDAVPRARARAIASGVTDPLQPIVPMSAWLPSYPDATRRTSRTQNLETAWFDLYLTPLSWQTQLPDVGPRARRAVTVDADVDPLQQPVPPITSWLPTYPDAPRRARRAAPADLAFVERPIALDWIPLAGYQPRRARAPLASTATEPPLFVPLVVAWLSTYPDSLRRPAPVLARGVTEPLLVAPAISLWLAEYPDSTRAPARARAQDIAAPVVALPNAPAPALSWAPTYPDRGLRSRSVVVIGGSFGPAAVLASPVPQGETFDALVFEMDDVIITHLG